MIEEKRLEIGPLNIVYNAALKDINTTAWPYLFDPNYLRQYRHVTHIARGRGETLFFDYATHKLVLKHYWRGGVLGKLNPDMYLRTRLENTRAYREWAVLRTLGTLNLPAPRPAGIRVLSGGLFYYADLITHQIMDVTPLGRMLVNAELGSETWQAVGKVIRRFHDAGVYHDDLNACNILLAGDAVYVIDFDRGRLRPGQAWKQNNLDRLLRSLKKEQRKAENAGNSFGFSDMEWGQLLKGYRSDGAPLITAM